MTPGELIRPILAEFDNESAMTRRVLLRAPGASWTWRPHEKSWTLGGLCTHLANVQKYSLAILREDAYELPAAPAAPRPDAASLDDVLAAFDTHTQAVRETLLAMSDVELQQPWEFRQGRAVLASMPRHGAFSRYAINHLVHHRGQLTVYLRLLDVPLPPLYGPTADEGF